MKTLNFLLLIIFLLTSSISQAVLLPKPEDTRLGFDQTNVLPPLGTSSEVCPYCLDGFKGGASASQLEEQRRHFNRIFGSEQNQSDFDAVD